MIVSLERRRARQRPVLVDRQIAGDLHQWTGLRKGTVTQRFQADVFART